MRLEMRGKKRSKIRSTNIGEDGEEVQSFPDCNVLSRARLAASPEWRVRGAKKRGVRQARVIQLVLMVLTGCIPEGGLRGRLTRVLITQTAGGVAAACPGPEGRA